MKTVLRRIIRKKYRKILREEVINKDYEYKKRTTNDAFFEKEIEPLEDSWAGGQNIHPQLDHSEEAGSDPNTRGVEVLKITENKLRALIRRVILEAKDQDDDGDNDFADVMIARMIKGGKSKKDAIKLSRKHNENEEENENLLIEPDVNKDRENEKPQYDKQKDEGELDPMDEYSSLGSGSIRGYQGVGFDPERPKS
jgi:hypothetical protein